jgi:hypothetical protein
MFGSKVVHYIGNRVLFGMHPWYSHSPSQSLGPGHWAATDPLLGWLDAWWRELSL